jgi:hypothetical protein
MEEKVYRLKHDSPGLKKGCLYRFDTVCGNYVCIDNNKYRKFPISRGITRFVASVELIENNPKWYERVYRVLPEYATEKEIKLLKNV